jgi:hypothetical protein
MAVKDDIELLQVLESAYLEGDFFYSLKVSKSRKETLSKITISRGA